MQEQKASFLILGTVLRLNRNNVDISVKQEYIDKSYPCSDKVIPSGEMSNFLIEDDNNILDFMSSQERKV